MLQQTKTLQAIPLSSSLSCVSINGSKGGHQEHKLLVFTELCSTGNIRDTAKVWIAPDAIVNQVEKGFSILSLHSSLQKFFCLNDAFRKSHFFLLQEILILKKIQRSNIFGVKQTSGGLSTSEIHFISKQKVIYDDVISHKGGLVRRGKLSAEKH